MRVKLDGTISSCEELLIGLEKAFSFLNIDFSKQSLEHVNLYFTLYEDDKLVKNKVFNLTGDLFFNFIQINMNDKNLLSKEN